MLVLLAKTIFQPLLAIDVANLITKITRIKYRKKKNNFANVM